MFEQVKNNFVQPLRFSILKMPNELCPCNLRNTVTFLICPKKKRDFTHKMKVEIQKNNLHEFYNFQLPTKGSF